MKRRSWMYIFKKFENNKTGNIVEKIINNPPIVGVPFFSFCPSNPKSLTVSPICLFLRNKIILFPNFIEIKSEKIKANEDLKDMYWNKLAPANWYWFSKYSNKKYNILRFSF